MKFVLGNLLFLTTVLWAQTVNGSGVKKATVKIYMHDLPDYGFMKKLIGNAFSLTGEGGRHWALVVQFEGDPMVYLCELHRDCNGGTGNITWISKRLSKSVVQARKQNPIVYDIGTVWTTPEELHEKCSRIIYDAQDNEHFLRNCQHWVIELIHKLGLSTTWFSMKTFLEKNIGPAYLMSLLQNKRL